MTESSVAGLRIAQTIGTDGPGGAERVVAQLAMSLQERGAQSVVVVPGGEGWLERELAGSGVAIEYFRIESPWSPRSARALGDTLRRHRIDLVHSHEFALAVYGAWACWRTRIPHVITMHGGRYHADRLRRRLILRAAVAASASTVAVSTPFARTLSRDLAMRRSHVVTIPNGVRYLAPARVTLRDELYLTPQDRLLVAVGNLYPVKGHQYLIDALAQLSDRHPTLHLAISGRGDLAGGLLVRARESGVHRRVHLLGLRADVPAVLEAADIFVLPSLSEGLPLALLEAMFAGRAIVASDVGDVRVALADGAAGIVVPPGDASAIADAIDRLLLDPDRARHLGAIAAQHARQEYDVSRMVDRYIDLYRSAIAGRSRPALTAHPSWKTL
jgi:glycosyltransferase involved in cell wall biosynthesis